MKILCLTDFSEGSINAINWTMGLCNSYAKADIEILHCVENRGRADMFVKIDDLFIEAALESLKKMQLDLEKTKKNVNVNISINAVMASPKSFVAKHAERNNFDLIVTGAKGLSNLRRYTVGSVTNDIIQHSKIPVFAIPSNCTFRGLVKMVLAIGEEAIKERTGFDKLNKIIKEHNTYILMAQVVEEDHLIKVDKDIEWLLQNNHYHFKTLPKEGSINQTLNAYADEENVDAIALIHNKRSLLNRFIQKSITKQELVQLQFPLFILPN